MANDLVRDILRMVQELPAKPTADDFWHLDRQIRDLWGGQRTYICKAQTEGKVRLLAESLAAGRPISEARNQLGMHRRTCARLLRRRWVSSY
jgi:hypothetical protein